MKWQPTPVFLPGESQGQRSLVGCLLSMGLHGVGHDWSYLAAAGYYLKPKSFETVCYITITDKLPIGYNVRNMNSHIIIRCFIKCNTNVQHYTPTFKLIYITVQPLESDQYSANKCIPSYFCALHMSWRTEETETNRCRTSTVSQDSYICFLIMSSQLTL